MPCDLIIFSRNALLPQTHDAITYFQGLGKPVVMDLDDGYFSLPWSNPARPFWNNLDFRTYEGQEEGGAMRMLEHALRISSGLIAPNRLLLQMYQHLAGNTYYLQNYAEPTWWSDLPDRDNGDRIVIGWGGSLSHYDSWVGSGILEAVEYTAKHYPNVWWKICGGDDKVFNLLPTHRKIRQPGVPPGEWPKIVRTFDIGVAPLFGIYDQYRSWIKGIEYALAGVPWIGTEGPTYNDLEGWGRLGPEVGDFWIESLETMIGKVETFQLEAENRREEARQAFVIDNQLNVFADVYSKILEDFKDNTDELPGVVYLEEQPETA